MIYCSSGHFLPFRMPLDNGDQLLVTRVQTTAAAAEEVAAEYATFNTAALFAFCGWDLSAGKVDEHLFQRGLADRVVLQMETLLRFLHHCEQLRPRHRSVCDMIVYHPLVDVFENTTGEGDLYVLHQCVQMIGLGHLGEDGAALTKPVFQMLSAAQTLELSVHHDCYTGTQSFTLVHAISQGKTPQNNK